MKFNPNTEAFFGAGALRSKVSSVKGRTFTTYLEAFRSSGDADERTLEKTLDSLFYRKYCKSKYYFPIVANALVAGVFLSIALVWAGFHMALPRQVEQAIRQLPKETMVALTGAFIWGIYDILRVIPKFGPFKSLGYRDPTAQTEDLYFKSMDNVVDQYHRLVQKVNAGDRNFPNRNLDTGAVTRAAQYKLADETYSQLARHIAHNHFALTTPALKANILEYFASGPAQHNIKPREWRNTQAALTELKSATGQTLDLGPQTSDLDTLRKVYTLLDVSTGEVADELFGAPVSRGCEVFPPVDILVPSPRGS